MARNEARFLLAVLVIPYILAVFMIATGIAASVTGHEVLGTSIEPDVSVVGQWVGAIMAGIGLVGLSGCMLWLLLVAMKEEKNA